MRQRRLRYGVVWMGISLISILLVIGVFSRIIETKQLENELSNFIVPNVTYNGTEYKIEKGEVFKEDTKIPRLLSRNILRIGRYSVLNRIDPIFALEGTDPDTLAIAIKRLKESRDELISLYPNKDQELLRTSLYPDGFLETLPELERLRKRLITSPDRKTIALYHIVLKHSLSEYISGLQSLKATYEALLKEPHNQESVFHSLGGYTSFPLAIQTLGVLELSATETRNKINKRIRCFHKTKECLLTTPYPEVTQTNPNNLRAEQDTLPEYMRTVKDLVIHYHTSINPSENAHVDTYPSIVLNQHTCSFSDKNAYQLFWRSTLEGNRAVQLEGLDDLYFYNTLRSENETSPYLLYLKNRGVSFFYQTQMNEYMCPDAGKEIAQVSTLFTLYSLLKETPIFANTRSERYQNLKEKEIAIRTARVLYESNMQDYLSEASSLLNKEGEAGLAFEIGARNVLRLERLISMFNEKSPNVSEILFHIVWTNRNAFSRMSDGRSAVTPLAELFIGRGYPMTLFLGFNHTLTGKSNPSFIIRDPNNPNVLGGLRFSTYFKDMQEEFTPEQILELMLNNYALRREMAFPRNI